MGSPATQDLADKHDSDKLRLAEICAVLLRKASQTSGLRAPLKVLAVFYALKFCTFLKILRIEVLQLTARFCTESLEDMRHLRPCLAHGPERVGNILRVEILHLLAASVHRASKTSGICVPVLAMAQSVLATSCALKSCNFACAALQSGSKIAESKRSTAVA